jgi:hypothetical protein
MGVNVSNIENNDSRNLCKYPGLGPNNVIKLKKNFDKGQINQVDKKKLMDILEVNKFETELVFEFFDIDGNGFIDPYEFICSVAMLTHSSVEVTIN